ncbi:hypothetical protein DXG01_012515 [Tephrocybe rancida]|nr:hypothetical protein DXG01_012515 [Tephrocybe rancida]
MAGEYDLIGKHPEADQTVRSATKYETTMEEMRSLVSPELELIESRIVAPLKEDKKDKSLNDEKNLFKTFKLEQDFEQATNEYDYINNALKVDFPRFMQLSTQFIDPLFDSFFYMTLNIYYLILEKMNSFADDAKYDITNTPGAQIQQDYETKRTDAWEVIENLGIIKRIVSVSKLVQASRQNSSGSGGGSLASRTPSTGSGSRVPPPAAPPSFKKAPPPPPGASSSSAPPPPYSPASSAASSLAATKRAPPPPPPLKPKPKPVPQIQYVIALYDFAAQADGDLSFNTGDRIEIVERTTNTEDWWTGRLHGEQGVFPGNYVQDA